MQNVIFYAFIDSKIMFAMKTAARIHVTTGISFAFLPASLQITYAIIPNAIPLEIEYANGITIIVINAGIPSVISSNEIEETDFIIKNPTKINAGAVAALGIRANNGVKKRASKNKTAVTTEERPVRAPAATPDEDSTKDVTVDVPRQAPATVPIESASKAPLALGIFPSSSTSLACSVTPIRVPIVSNKSVNKNVKNTIKNFPVKTFAHSNWNNKGADGIETGFQPSGIVVTPKGKPTIVVIIIPRRIEPGTLRTNKTIVIIKPMIATRAVDTLKFTNPIIVPVAEDVIPAFVKPIKQINKPIPTATAFLNVAGIDLIIASRTPNTERRIKTRPSIKTAVKANCHEQPIPKHTVYVKNAFSPIPGARATGKLAINAIAKVAIADAIAVAVKTPPKGIPVSDNIPGFTARM